MSLGNGETDSIANTLAQRTSGDLNAGGVVSLGVTGRLAVDALAEKEVSGDEG